MSKKQLIEYIEELNYLKFYDAVPGVKHPSAITLSREEKLAALADIISRLGRLPLIGYGEKIEEGKHGAKPYGNIEVEQREEAEELSGLDIRKNIIIEVNLEKEEHEEKGILNRFAASDQTPASIPPIVHDVLRASGQPLDTATRAFMEPRFGQDFSRVRVHTDARAAESARAVNALAYTVGRDVVFGAGQYAPGTPEGHRLIAHELAHVMQQLRGGSTQPSLIFDNLLEQGAEQAAQSTIKGLGKITVIGTAAPSIACQSKYPEKYETLLLTEEEVNKGIKILLNKMLEETEGKRLLNEILESRQVPTAKTEGKILPAGQEFNEFLTCHRITQRFSSITVDVNELFTKAKAAVHNLQRSRHAKRSTFKLY